MPCQGLAGSPPVTHYACCEVSRAAFWRQQQLDMQHTQRGRIPDLTLMCVCCRASHTGTQLTARDSSGKGNDLTLILPPMREDVTILGVRSGSPAACL